MGGTAYLTMLSTEDEPFLSGLSFTAMPPTKRWRQMEALSGGEKVWTWNLVRSNVTPKEMSHERKMAVERDYYHVLFIPLCMLQ